MDVVMTGSIIQSSKRAFPIGWIDGIVDGAARGWAWDEFNPKSPVRLDISIDENYYGSLTPQDFRGDLVDSGISHGCFGFVWRIPQSFRDNAVHSIVFTNSATNELIPGSPTQFQLTGLDTKLEIGGDIFVNADFSIWPNGVCGSFSGPLTEIGKGVFVSLREATDRANFELYGHRNRARDAAPYYGLKIRFKDEGQAWIHHRFGPAATNCFKRMTRLTLETQLCEAPDILSQRVVEVWLTQETADGFSKVRRLHRGRVFRLETTLYFPLLFTSDEVALADARVLMLSTTIEKSNSFSVFPAQVLSAQPVDTVGLVGFEDGDFGSSLLECRQLAAALGKERDYDKLCEIEQNSHEETVSTPRNLDLQIPFTQIIVPVYNGDDYVLKCLRSIQEATTSPFQVLIVSDGSGTHTNQLIDQFVDKDPRFIFFKRQQNIGYTKTINEAVRLSSADWLVVLNSDTVVSRDWLVKLHLAAIAHPGVGMAGPVSNAASYQSIPFLRNADGSWSRNDFISASHLEHVQNALDNVTTREYPLVPLLNGFCTLISRRLFEVCGLYDEQSFPLGYGEETDLCLRASQNGFKLVVADDCFVYHHKSISFGKTRRANLSRSGNLELANKHLGKIISQREQTMLNCGPLAKLRARLEYLRTELS